MKRSPDAYWSKRPDRILGLAREFPRYGYRIVTQLLRQEGWTVNLKRIYLLWKREEAVIFLSTVRGKAFRLFIWCMPATKAATTNGAATTTGRCIKKITASKGLTYP